MSIVAVPQPLTSLVEFLNELESRAPLEDLRRHLSGLDVSLQDLRPYMQFGNTSYSRNLICQNQWYELLCICWKDGQQSPIHNHAGSTCGLRVMTGVAVETTFRETADGKVIPLLHRQLTQGTVCCAQDSDIHRVANLQGDGSSLVTLHIYSPPLRNVGTWEQVADAQAGQNTETG
jgi:cysteine dioxygenase